MTTTTVKIDAHNCELLRSACVSRAAQLRRIGDYREACELDRLARLFLGLSRHHIAASCPGCMESHP